MLCLSVLLASFTPAPAKRNAVEERINSIPIESNAVSILYNELDLAALGLSKKAFEYAYKGYKNLQRKNKLDNTRYLTICDMGQSSRKKRLYVIDMDDRQVVMNTWVAHGRNSGSEYASKFSNKISSHQTSLGFYVTGHTYSGEHGLSLRMQGLETGFNDKAYRRAVVVHGADYIGKSLLNQGRMGRSYGCPAVPKEESKELIDLIKNGTCLFIYYPSTNYLRRSKILNG